MILVTGSAGKTGQQLIRALASRQVPVRAMVRNDQAGKFTISCGATEYVVADMGDKTAMIRACQNARSIYHICPNVSPNEVLFGDNVIMAAKRVGVEHFVYHSVLHPQTQAMPHHWQKLRVEERLFESGLSFTILQPAAYMQNVQGYRDAILKNRRYSVPYSTKTRTTFVDLEDVAEVGSIVLTESGHKNAIYELAGPDTLTPADIAKRLSAHLGAEIEARMIGRDEWIQSAKGKGLDTYQIETLLAMFDYYEQFGFIGNPTVLALLLGRNPTSFGSYLNRSFAR